MAAGFGIRTGSQLTMRVMNRTRRLARLNYFNAQSGDAFSLLVAKASVLTGLVVSDSLGLSPRFGVNYSRERNRRSLRGWAVALILKPVPQRVGDSGRLIAFW